MKARGTALQDWLSGTSTSIVTQLACDRLVACSSWLSASAELLLPCRASAPGQSAGSTQHRPHSTMHFTNSICMSFHGGFHIISACEGVVLAASIAYAVSTIRKLKQTKATALPMVQKAPALPVLSVALSLVRKNEQSLTSAAVLMCPHSSPTNVHASRA